MFKWDSVPIMRMYFIPIFGEPVFPQTGSNFTSGYVICIVTDKSKKEDPILA